MLLETDVPLPAKRGPARKYPWHSMAVGQSFWAPTYANNLRATAKYHEMRYGFQFVIRKDGDGARAWRVA